MGLLLRTDAYIAETSDGAYVLTHEGESTLTGRSVHQLIDRLAPFLDGQHTLAELTAELPADRREMVRKLIVVLTERGVIRETGPNRVADTAPIGDRHETSYVGYFLDSPNRLFRAYQGKRTLVIGAGRLCHAVAMAATRSGLGHIRLVTTAECPTDSAWERPDVDLSQVDAGEPLRSLLVWADLVLHASDRPRVERAYLLDHLCEEADVLLAHALVIDGHAWIRSAAVGARDGAGWSSCRRRLLARRTGATKAGAWQETPTRPVVSELAATAVAAQLVHGVFQVITGTADPPRHRITRVCLSTLASEACTVVPHPFSRPLPRAARTKLSDTGTTRLGERVAAETFSRRAAACADDHVGVFGVPTEREFAQVPLHVCEIEVSDPIGLLDPDSPLPKVFGAALDFAAARHQAASKAVSGCASLMIDPRRLDIIGGRPVDPGIDPDRALSALRSGRATGFVRGYHVADGDTRLVDVTQAFPALRAPAPVCLPPPGVGAAHDWHEAVVAGLIDQCMRRTVREMAASRKPFDRIDLADANLDARGDRYRALLATIGDAVTVHDVTGWLGVPTMLCYLGSTAAGCASSLSAADALTGALEQATLRYQATVNHQPDYAPPMVCAIPDRLRGSVTRQLPDRPACDRAAVVAALAERGHQAIAVPLDHDPEINAIMPYIVRVVIVDE